MELVTVIPEIFGWWSVHVPVPGTSRSYTQFHHEEKACEKILDFKSNEITAIEN